MEKLARLNLKALRAVDALARHGNLAAAAQELYVSPGAVSKHVLNIEDALGTKLFRRTGSGFKPTAHAAAFLAELGQGFKLVSRSIDRLHADHSTTIRVTVAPAFAKSWLIPRLPRFYAIHPAIEIDLDASRDVVDLGGGEYDGAIRLGTGEWPGHDIREIMVQLLFPVCVPDLQVSLREIRDLSEVGIIHSATLRAEWKTWLAALGAGDLTLARKLMLSDEDMCLSAALNGLGVTLSWQTQAFDLLASGRLVAPFPWSVPSGRSYWLLTRCEMSRKPALVLFEKWLLAEVATCEARSDLIPSPIGMAASV